jgi:predicted transcriptional regulator
MLSIIEQKILLDMRLYEFRNMKFSYTNQTVVKERTFFKIMSVLREKGKINIVKSGRNSRYTLTDSGRLDANQRCLEYDTDKIYWFLGRKIGGIWYA